MADELFQGVKIKELPVTTTANDTDDIVIEDSTPVTKRIRFSNLVAVIKSKVFPDTGWKTATLTASFGLYGAGLNPPKYRKIGNKVLIEGVVAPAKTLTSSATSVAMFTLPAGYRPKTVKYVVCHGSIKNIWLLTVSPDGDVSVARYGTSGFTDMTTSAWLPFNLEFVID